MHCPFTREGLSCTRFLNLTREKRPASSQCRCCCSTQCAHSPDPPAQEPPSTGPTRVFCPWLRFGGRHNPYKHRPLPAGIVQNCIPVLGRVGRRSSKAVAARAVWRARGHGLCSARHCTAPPGVLSMQGACGYAGQAWAASALPAFGAMHGVGKREHCEGDLAEPIGGVCDCSACG